MRLVMIIAGVVTVLAVLWFRAEKKLTADYAGLWGILGTLLIVIGAVSPFFGLVRKVCKKSDAGLLAASILFFAGGFFVSVKLSELKMKNQELAICVSLLLGENERIMSESDGRAQKDSVCHQHTGAGRGGEGSAGAFKADRQ